jgi:hypothetical protein
MTSELDDAVSMHLEKRIADMAVIQCYALINEGKSDDVMKTLITVKAMRIIKELIEDERKHGY